MVVDDSPRDDYHTHEAQADEKDPPADNQEGEIDNKEKLIEWKRPQGIGKDGCPILCCFERL